MVEEKGWWVILLQNRGEDKVEVKNGESLFTSLSRPNLCFDRSGGSDVRTGAQTRLPKRESVFKHCSNCLSGSLIVGVESVVCRQFCTSNRAVVWRSEQRGSDYFYDPQCVSDVVFDVRRS